MPVGYESAVHTERRYVMGDPLSPSVRALLALRSDVTEFAQYLQGWSGEHMPDVTEHEIRMMHTAGRELLRIVNGEGQGHG